MPTCHRTSFQSIVADDDYKSALEYADEQQKRIYKADAIEIDKIQKDILAIAQKESPYDVFICYKETDENGARTKDSVIANDIYYQLTQEGFKVFYAAITLEDKLGSAYEPIIFSALNSAKVMLVIGTKPEYLNAVWVKNEWSRYLKMIQKDRSKMLIPCYRDMDPYDLPEEFAHLQAQDMGKIGFITDLIRGIKKVLQATKEKTVVVQATSGAQEDKVAPQTNNKIAPLLKRAYLFLEDGDFDNAKAYAERILDIDPEFAEAYVVRALIDLRLTKVEQLVANKTDIGLNSNFIKALRFATQDYRVTLAEYQKANEEFLAEKKKEIIYNNALGRLNNAPDDVAYKKSIAELESIIDYKDSDEKIRLLKRRLTTWYYDQEEKNVVYIGQVPIKQAQFEEIVAELRQGNKIAAIRLVKDLSSLGLADAKKWVENYTTYDLRVPQAGYGSTSSYNPYVAQGTISNTTSFSSSNQASRSEIKKLEEKYRKQMIWGFIGLLYWPIAVILFACAASTKKKIKALKGEEPVKQGGCYVATCVYGSYDCPEVWTLRRYRDKTLGTTWYGRAFIRVYYAISPTLVKWFGKTKWFKKMWKGKLDRMVKKLHDEGVENSPYQDKNWK